ncbi:hypothetical protein GCM10010211_52470 [Streptomyces albospinus]|uniref:UL36 very large tegument protein n=1 Tax=Streptomyces albospinus TaxID=285515 RepID=A0ABQ2VEL1_9ACTN|nr:hypothetical protein [Streptomyces albospinus]GGU79906.1 hypothetical protein GCM10010211_52470 [Streptomyces albospinus]
MTVIQLRSPAEEFARFLTDLGRLLDPAAGWYGVFVQRDPEGLRACLEGREVPHWDVVESLLHDLATQHGDAAVRTMGPRARRLYARAVAGHDAQPGGRPALRDRLAVMVREQRQAAARSSELRVAARFAQDPAEGERLSRELAWAQDDHLRAGARVRELRARLASLEEAGEGARAAAPGGDAAAAAGDAPARGGGSPAREGETRAGEAAPPAPEGDAPAAEAASLAAEGAAPARTAKSPARKDKAAGRPRGARFAGLEVADEPAPADDRPTPDGPAAAPAASGPAPRGARFAGAYAAPGGGPEDGPGGDAPGGAADPGVRRCAARTAYRLAHHRPPGEDGPAYVEICTAAARPAAELPYLLDELEIAGLTADIPTLLWEVACLPPDGLAAATEALVAAGRPADGSALLRQSVARPVAEVGRTALALLDRGRPEQAGELLAALVRARTPDDAAAVAAADPVTLGPLLLEAARTVSPSRHGDVARALRAAGHPAPR